MRTLILLLSFLPFTLFAQEEVFEIKYVKMGVNNGKASGEVILKNDSILHVYLVGSKENTFIHDTLTRSRIFYLNEYWYKATVSNCYIALYRDLNKRLYKIGIYNPYDKVTWWIE